eukprot:15357875-Ditylum_brightwellii.AAC.1
MYLSTNQGNMVYPLPVVQRGSASKEYFFALLEADISLYQAIGLRSLLLTCTKEEGDDIINVFLGDHAPHLVVDSIKTHQLPKDNATGNSSHTNNSKISTGKAKSKPSITSSLCKAASSKTTPKTSYKAVALVKPPGSQLQLTVANKEGKEAQTFPIQISREQSLRLNLSYHITIQKSNNTQDYIKDMAFNIIAKALENMAESMRMKDGRPIALVWAPWDDVSTTKSVEFSRPNQVMKALKDLNWRGARELLNNAYFKHNGKKGASNNTRRSCNIRILFDGMEKDKSWVKKQFSDELRGIDSRNQ